MTTGIRFDNYLDSLQTDTLRSLASTWGKTKSTRKADMAHEIRRGLADARHVADVIQRLSPFAKAALAVIRSHNGRLFLSSLTSSLIAAGYMPRPQIYETVDRRVLRDLQAAGIIIIDPSYNSAYGYSSYYQYNGAVVLSDERLFTQAPALSIVPFNVEAVAPPQNVLVRRPITVTLDMIAFLQAIDNLGGIQLNKNGSVRVGDLRKLVRALGWAETEHSFDGIRFHNPVDAFLEAFEIAGLLVNQGGYLVVQGADEFAQMPTPLQVLKMLNAFLNVQGWSERGSSWSGYGVGNGAAMRNSLLLVLSTPQIGQEFMSVASVSRALFERIGGSFSLTGMTHPHFEHPNLSEADKEKQRQRYLDQQRQSWQRSEDPWIRLALSSWMYFLGMVELGAENGVLSAVRLSELARQALRPSEVQEKTAASGPAWMIQPDFEIMVYLDHVAPLQLSLLERIAERVQIQSHMARYKLTRESIYQALERGIALEDMLKSLTDGAGVALPQNVAASLRDWGMQREKYTLYRRARLLEMPSQAARDQLLSTGIAGTPVGERYILVSEEDSTTRKAIKIDYTQPLPPALKATEDGHVTIVRQATDVLLKPMLDRWAEPQPDGSWQFTPASVASVTKRGGASTLISMLDQRLTHDIPPLLALTLRAWAGENVKTKLGRISVIQFDDANVTEAVRTSQRFAQYILGGIGSTTLLVKQSDLKKVRALLADSGIDAQAIDE